MSYYRRADRVGDLLRHEISDIIRNRIKDPRIGFVTVIRVELSDDLRYAKIYVSVLGSETERSESLKGLESATSFIRGELGRRVRLRHIPEILFRYDDSIEHGVRINKLLESA